MRINISSYLVLGAACILLILGALRIADQSLAAGTHAQQMHRLHVINADLDFKPKIRPAQGRLQGYDPVVTTVRVGDQIRFVNTDDIQHTATGFAFGGQVVPEHYKFVSDPTRQTGRIIDAHEWSTGTLRAHGGKSQLFVTKTTGNFYYGCAYHLGSGMRGVIVVLP